MSCAFICNFYSRSLDRKRLYAKWLTSLSKKVFIFHCAIGWSSFSLSSSERMLAANLLNKIQSTKLKPSVCFWFVNRFCLCWHSELSKTLVGCLSGGHYSHHNLSTCPWSLVAGDNGHERDRQHMQWFTAEFLLIIQHNRQDHHRDCGRLFSCAGQSSCVYSKSKHTHLKPSACTVCFFITFVQLFSHAPSWGDDC